MSDEIRMSIELREDENRLGPGRLVGTLMVYGERAKDRAEVFEIGSLKWDKAGIVVNRQHTRTAPVMRVVPIVEGNEVRIDAQIPDTSAGRDAAAEIRGGSDGLALFRGLSVEFKAVRQSIVGGVRRITEAVLSGAAIVDSPSYAGATVEVRAKEDINRPTEETLWL